MAQRKVPCYKKQFRSEKKRRALLLLLLLLLLRLMAMIDCCCCCCCWVVLPLLLPLLMLLLFSCCLMLSCLLELLLNEGMNGGSRFPSTQQRTMATGDLHYIGVATGDLTDLSNLSDHEVLFQSMGTPAAWLADLAARRPIGRVQLSTDEARSGDASLRAAFALWCRAESTRLRHVVLPDCRECGRCSGRFCDECSDPRCASCCERAGDFCRDCSR